MAHTPSVVTLVKPVRDSLQVLHKPGTKARMVAQSQTKVTIEFFNDCPFRRGRATVPKEYVK